MTAYPKSPASSAARFLSPVRHRILQRKCACGGAPGPSGECEECRNKRLQRKAAALHPANQSNAVAPPIVHEVLRSPGQPLDPAARAFMETRFGYDFSHVRVHHDARAAKSAQAVHALAYTVGRNVVLGAGGNRLGTASENALMAHELAHTIQQREEAGPAPTSLAMTNSHDPAEAEAEAAARAAIQDGSHATLSRHPARIARQTRADQSVPPQDAGVPGGTVETPPAAATAPFGPAPPATTAPAAAPSAPAPTAFVCGPDVTEPLKAAVTNLRAMYAGWSANQKEEACWALENTSCGPDAWDVVEFHNNAWIYQNYRPACASAGAKPLCGSSVQVGSDCHNAGSANYVAFGTMCDLCGIWKPTMHLAILAHKVHLTGLDADYGAASAWADAGFAGWPGAANPPGDRNNCSPTCKTPFAGQFTVHWYPSSPLETVNSSCPPALKVHQDIRDHPPDPSGGVGF